MKVNWIVTANARIEAGLLTREELNRVNGTANSVETNWFMVGGDVIVTIYRSLTKREAHCQIEFGVEDIERALQAHYDATGGSFPTKGSDEKVY